MFHRVTFLGLAIDLIRQVVGVDCTVESVGIYLLVGGV